MHFIDITTKFPSTTKLKIDGDHMLNYIYTEYNLDVEQLPLKTIFLVIDHIFQNLNFHSEIFFRAPISKVDKVIKQCIKSTIINKKISIKWVRGNKTSEDKMLKNILINEDYNCNNLTMKENLEDACLILTSFKDINIKDYLSNGSYVVIFEYMELLYPHLNMFVLTPFTEDLEFFTNLGIQSDEFKNEYEYDTVNDYKSQESLESYCHKKGIDLNELKAKTNDDYKNYYTGSDKLDAEFFEILGKYEKIDFLIDGRVFLKLTNKQNYLDEIEIDKLNIKTNYNLENIYEAKTSPVFECYDSRYCELEMLMVQKEKIPQRNVQKYTQHLKQAAQSLYGDRLLYKPLTKTNDSQGKEIKVKISKKQLQIIKENEERQQKERIKEETLFLKGFFSKYKIANDDKKLRMFANINLNNYNVNSSSSNNNLIYMSDFVKQRIFLLKIEFFYEKWCLERRKENIDESVMIPLYTSCLEFLKINSDEKMRKFVFDKLIECGFKATVDEIIFKQNLKDPKIGKEPKSLNKDSTKENHDNFKKSLKEEYEINDFDLTFQMKHAGDKLERTLESQYDPRVLFKPDGWQIKLLDIVDQNKSAVISAPTSAGKTFICYYAIEKILRKSETDCVIFCLPTKALVNQVAADIYARFNKNFNRKLYLQGILMPDFQVVPNDCQVLITIPFMLEALLKENTSRIKYIIIDEIHKISSRDMGVYIERVIHLSPCPILVLSATLGNLTNFYNWLKAVEKMKNRECELVLHQERYCDIKVFNYSNDEIVHINPLYSFQVTKHKNKLLETQNLKNNSHKNEEVIRDNDNIDKDNFGNDIHPKEDKINIDEKISYENLFRETTIDFLPEDTLNFYYTLYSVLRKDQIKLFKKLRPKKFFKSNIISKADVTKYKNFLFNSVNTWIKEKKIDYSQGLKIIEISTEKTKESLKNINLNIDNQILPLLNKLKERNMLPCIVFNIDREICNRLAKKVFLELEKVDIDKEEREVERYLKELKRNRDKEKKKDDWIEESIRDEETSHLRKNKCDIKYTFLDPLDRISDSELDNKIGFIRKNMPKIYLQMLYRGIGIHHNGMNKKYRELVEILFRTKHLKVIFSTETLSLGINMPCRTVIFAGDNINLEPLNFRQMSGRAGRRGYDTLGNVIFLGIHSKKIDMLIGSDMDEIRGNYSYVNTSFIYRNEKYLQSILKYPLCAIKYQYESINDKSNYKDNPKNKDNYNNNENKNTTINENDFDCYNTINGDNDFKNMNEIVSSNEYLKNKNEDMNMVFFNLQTNFLKNISILNYKNNQYVPSMLADIVVLNKTLDPNIFIFLMLISYQVIDLDRINANELFLIFAHLFQVRPTLIEHEFTLKPLSGEVLNFLNQINNVYKRLTEKFLSKEQKFLQNELSTPILKIKSFPYFENIPKNSYLFDFFIHGDKNKIINQNKISEGDLWNSCHYISNLMKSIIMVMDCYRLKGKKNIENILTAFLHKFMVIFA
ncbi:hypothetical protein DMUE_3348 [Dictyocoela muelleri]|nr:hypothetical protein DMUE_3348 [Dictyocoela muelleri]